MIREKQRSNALCTSKIGEARCSDKNALEMFEHLSNGNKMLCKIPSLPPHPPKKKKKTLRAAATVRLVASVDAQNVRLQFDGNGSFVPVSLHAGHHPQGELSGKSVS